jgi:hypothetical protein
MQVSSFVTISSFCTWRHVILDASSDRSGYPQSWFWASLCHFTGSGKPEHNYRQRLYCIAPSKFTRLTCMIPHMLLSPFHRLDLPSYRPIIPLFCVGFSISGQGISVRVVRTMIRPRKLLTLVSLLCATIFSGSVVAWHPSLRSLSAKRLEAVKLRETSARRAGAGNARRATRAKNITFSNPKASGAYARVHAFTLFFLLLCSEFYVDGRSIPDVNFDVGPSWSGLIPISGAANETRKVRLFKLGNATDELRLNSYSFSSCSSGSSLRLRKEAWMISSSGITFLPRCGFCIDRILNDCPQGLTVVLVARRY